jgi:hypothetical protein
MKDKSNAQQGTSSEFSLGLALVVVALLALAFARMIPDSALGNNRDPGPRAFPLLLSAALLIGGIIQLVRHFAIGSIPRGDRNVAILLAALVLYVPAIAWIGFALSTLLFSAGTMTWLGTRWFISVLISIGLVVVVEVLFVLLFKVQLPAGALGLPF